MCMNAKVLHEQPTQTCMADWHLLNTCFVVSIFVLYTYTLGETYITNITILYGARDVLFSENILNEHLLYILRDGSWLRRNVDGVILIMMSIQGQTEKVNLVYTSNCVLENSFVPYQHKILPITIMFTYYV